MKNKTKTKTDKQNDPMVWVSRVQCVFVVIEPLGGYDTTVNYAQDIYLSDCASAFFLFLAVVFVCFVFYDFYFVFLETDAFS